MRLLLPVLLVSAVFLAGDAVAQEEIYRELRFVDGSVLEKRIYRVPASFLSTVSVENPSAQKILERAGLTFGSGCSAKFHPRPIPVLVVCTTEDNFELLDAFLGTGGCLFSGEADVTTIVERIEVERSFLNQWLLEHELDPDGTALRNAVQKLIRDDQAIVLDTVVVAGRSGQRARVESLSEYIYPTETGLENNTITNPQNSAAKKPKRPPIVEIIAWETRYTGITLQVDPVVGEDGEIVDVNLTPEFVRLAGFESATPEGLPVERSVRMPVFYTERINSQLTLRSGHYGFLGSTDPLEAAKDGTEDPVVLSFVRVDVAEPVW